MLPIDLQELMAAGVHLGHQSRKWHPKMMPFIYSKKDHIHIIDLLKTRQQIEEAIEFLKQAVKEQKTIVFVGTKRQAAPAVEGEAQRAQVFYVNHRWIGGILTNFTSIEKTIKKYQDLTSAIDGKDFAKLTTRDKFKTKEEVKRLGKLVGGLKGLTKIPDLLVIVDPNREKAALHEAKITATPVIALLDTNADPTHITVPIPVNDDSLRSVGTILKFLAQAIIEAKKD